jgi:hypothetical protein
MGSGIHIMTNAGCQHTTITSKSLGEAIFMEQPYHWNHYPEEDKQNDTPVSNIQCKI